MGNIISSKHFSPNHISGTLKPIIYCCRVDSVEQEAISINVLLAEKLKLFRPNRRSIRLEMLFNEVLEQLPDDVIIKDIDVLFNPNYKVDVMKILMMACKKKNFSLIWPGSFQDGKLSYAENGYQDYKIFNVEEYDVTCIV